MKTRGRLRILVAAVLAVMLLPAFVGCAAKSVDTVGKWENEAPEYMTEGAPMEPAAPAPMAEPEMPAGDIEDLDIPLAPEEAGFGTQGLKDTVEQNPNRKLIFRFNYQLETLEFEESYNKITAALSAAGGYIEEELTEGTKPEVYGDDGRRASLTLRVPAENADAFLAELSESGTVVSKNRTTEDVTTSYFDRENRIEFYEAEYDALKGLLNKATEMEDIITIKYQMSEILYNLESLKGEKRHTDEQIAYCTINISLRELVKAEKVAVSEKTTGERAGDAFSNSIMDVGQGLQDFAVFLAGAVPVIVVISVTTGVPVGIVLAIVLSGKKRKARRAAALAAKQAEVKPEASPEEVKNAVEKPEEKPKQEETIEK